MAVVKCRTIKFQSIELKYAVSRVRAVDLVGIWPDFYKFTAANDSNLLSTNPTE